jgi:hypothetical protein
MSGLLLGLVLSVCTCWFHNMFILTSWTVYANFGTISLCMLKCIWTHYHVSLFIVLCQKWASWCNLAYCLVILLTQFAFVICFCFQHFFAWYVFKAWSVTAVSSNAVSAFGNPLDSHTNVSSSLISYTSIFLIYCPNITLLSHLSFRNLLSLLLYVCSSSFVSLLSFVWFKSSTVVVLS